MTTNVYDQDKSVVATDSRWTFTVRGKTGLDLPDISGFVDDTGFDKIVFDDTAVFMFAGSGALISEWREAVLQRNLLKGRPGVARNFAICIVRLSDGAVLFEHGQKISGATFRFAGTGAEPAYDCWKQNGDAHKAVVSAQVKDRASGGQVKFLERADRKHNLDFSVPFNEVVEKFLNKGRIMYNTHTAPVAEAIKDDPRAAEFVDRIKQGQIQAEAPSGFDPVVWTSDDEMRLNKALADHYGSSK